MGSENKSRVGLMVILVSFPLNKEKGQNILAQVILRRHVLQQAVRLMILLFTTGNNRGVIRCAKNHFKNIPWK